MAYRLLLDTSSLTYRAFFALPTSITGSDGRPVNAVRGYLDMTTRLMEDRGPDEVIHVFDDDWRPAPRVDAYDGYKSQRADDPDDLPQQFTLLVTVLRALGQPIAIAEGWEADDAIGALCVAAEPGDRVDVVTGDRDLIQLVRDGDPAVRVLFTVRGVSELHEFDETAVVTKYGIPASRYVDFATLRGDPSDGLPGVKGVGEKTARTLVGKYASIRDLLDHARDQSKGLAFSLLESREYLEAMREVVPVRTDVPVAFDRQSRDDDAVARLAQQHNLEGPLTRIIGVLDA